MLPGMGADSSMYPAKYYDQLTEVNFIDWPEYSGEKSIEEVAEKIIEIHRPENDKIIGGSSLGGMVAIQVAKMVNIKRVLLVSSTINSSNINPALRKISGLAELTPIELIQVLAGKLNLHLKKDVLTMFENSDTDFIRSMCVAVFEWPGIEDYKCEVRHIHGKLDMVIFPPKKDVKIIPWGGHLISMTHGDLVSRFIKNKLNSF